MNQALIILGAWNVARLTRHFFVSPTQGETTVGFVIKFLGEPIERDMARSTINSQAIGGFSFSEFALMNVIVATGAIFCRALESQLHLARIAGGFMACRARSGGVAVFQRVFGCRMIEDRLTPGVFGVTGRAPVLTVGSGDFFSLAQMGITVAVGTRLESGCQINRLGVDRFGVHSLGGNARRL